MRGSLMGFTVSFPLSHVIDVSATVQSVGYTTLTWSEREDLQLFPGLAANAVS